MVDLLSKRSVISTVYKTFLVHLFEFVFLVLEQSRRGLGSVNCFNDRRVVVLEFSNIQHCLLDILFNFVNDVVQLLVT